MLPPLPEYSNKRVQVVKLSLEVPIILINVYLPASSLPAQEYDDSLNLLSSIISNYQAEAAVFLAGDFNRSLFRNNQGDAKFQSFCKIAGLFTAAGTTQLPTYHGYNGSESTIDYVLMHKESCETFGIREGDLKISRHLCKEDDPTIVSTHDIICFELCISTSSAPTPVKTSVKFKPLENKTLLWEKADIELYQEHLESLLEHNFDFWNTPECISILSMLIPQAFIQAANVAVPSKQKKDINFKVLKSEEWRKCESAAKKATKKWKSMGKPRDENNKHFVEKSKPEPISGNL